MRHYPTLAERFHYCRRLTGMTQPELARAAGCSTRLVQYVEKGERIPSLKLLTKLAGAMGMPIDYLRHGNP